VQTYEAGGLGMPSAAAAAAYLQRAEERRQAGDGAAAVELWRKALVADPGNLYALWQLRQAARVAGDDATAAHYEEQLRYSDLRSVAVPSHVQLAEYQGQAMAQLAEAGIWTDETLHNIASYQVWQFAQGEVGRHTERVLQALLWDRPGDIDLRFYLAELYHRRGEWEQAEAAYRAVLERDAAYAQAMLRLGMVFQARGRLAEAADWYARYRALAPDDLLGLERLVEVHEVLGAPDTTALREQLRDRSDDRRIAAQLLGVPADAVQLGENLVRNGDFESWLSGRPEWWSVSNMATGDPWNEGLFIGGREELDAPGGSALRIQGMWLRQEPDKEPGRWGYWYFDERSRRIATLPLEPDGVYLISFDYRSDAEEGQGAAVYVSDREEVLWRGDRRLPKTGYAWRHFVAVAANRSGAEATMRLLLRHWGSGVMAFDRVRVSRLELPGELRGELGSARFWSGGL
jgi:tetratricopeptide (TPR) repeat protein